MEVYLYNYDFSEQSLRQMETVISFLDSTNITVDKKWERFFVNTINLEYMDFEYFMNQNDYKAIMFFNIIDGYHLSKYKHNDNLSFIFRPRGIVPEESYYKRKNIFKKIVLNFIENKVVKFTDFFIFLNNAQKIHYLSKYNNKSSTLIGENIVLPNVKIKNSNYLNLKKPESKVRIVYSGGFSKWQNIELVFSIVSNILKKCSFCDFTILTFRENFDVAEKLAKQYNIFDKLMLKYISPNKVDEELSKYDIGIIIRDNSIINVTASPFKIIDYVSNGLGVIVTDSIACEVREILKEEYFYELEYHEGQLLFSEENLFKYVLTMVNGRKKIDIIKHYDHYVSEVKGKKINDIINLSLTKKK